MDAIELLVAFLAGIHFHIACQRIVYRDGYSGT
jgi:hypothetical protein